MFGQKLTISCEQGSRLREPEIARIAGCLAEENRLHWTTWVCHALSG